MKLVTRKAWGARSPRAAPERLSSTRGVKVHYTGDYVKPELLTDHSRCALKVRDIQDSHMDGNGWNDIGYSALVCPHAYVFVGRGPHALPAANGEGLNSGHYAVCGLVGNRGLTQPTPAMLAGIRDAIEWLRREGDAGTEIKGHRDGYATDCPGGPLYAWVKKGAPRPDEEDDMDPTTLIPVGKTWAGEFSKDAYQLGYLEIEAVARGRRIERQLAALASKVGVDVDESAIVAGVLAGLSPDAIAQAVAETLPDDLARQVLDGLKTRLEA